MTQIKLDAFGFLSFDAYNAARSAAERKPYAVFGRDGPLSSDNFRPGIPDRNGSAQYNHQNPTAFANSSQLLRDLAMFSDTNGVPFYDHFQYATNGRLLPNSSAGTVPTTAGGTPLFSDHYNGGAHPGWQAALASDKWMGDLEAEWQGRRDAIAGSGAPREVLVG